jgi:hypothetical protein
MSSRAEARMDLREWMSSMAEQVREPFSAEHLEAVDRCVQSNRTAGLLLLSFIGACAHQGWTTDKIGLAITCCILEERLAADGSPPDVAPELIDEVVTPTVQQFTSQGAPWSRPWDATGLYTVLLWAVAANATERGVPWEEAEYELSRWTGGGNLRVPLPPQAPTARAEIAALTRSMQALRIEEPAGERERREADSRRCLEDWPAELRLRADLLDTFALRHLVEWTRTRDARAPGLFSEVTREELARLLEAIATCESEYPPFEREMLRGQDPDVRFRRECLSAMHEGSSWFPGRFPDRIKGEDRLGAVPQHFVGGSRSAYSSATSGRTCWVYLLRTPRQVSAFMNLPPCVRVEVGVGPGQIRIHPFNLDDPSMPEPISCDRASARDIWRLLVALDGGWATVRVVEFTGVDYRLLDAWGMNISSEIVRAVGDPLSASLAELTGRDPSALPRLVRAELESEEEDMLNRVCATEMARGSFLVSGFDFRFGHTGEIPDETVADYKRARKRLLSLRAAEAVGATSISPEALHLAQREMTDLHELVRVLRSGPLASFARVLADPDRALALLRIDRGTVYADWACVRPGAELTSYTDPERCAEALVTGSTDLGEIQPLADAANAWFESKGASVAEESAALEEMLDVIGAEIMEPLYLELAGKRELLLSPAWFLGLLPLHAAQLRSDDDATGRFDVTYVPGAVLLDRLVGLGPVRVEDCLAATGEQPVPKAAEELRVLEALFATTPTHGLTPEMAVRSPSASIVHLAAHGYARIDGWSSGLALSGEPSGYLPLARLLLEGDYSATGVVNIAACESGLELTYELLPSEYLSIDNALLACGARSVVSSLWKLSGPVSVLFSACFYAAIVEGAQVGDAYRAATSSVRALDRTQLPARVRELLDRVYPDWRKDLRQEELRAKVPVSHPYFWAGFKCSGWSWGALEGPRNDL